ncbi:MAG TPA: PKD domain-containing protein [Candidatus Thermoplasmatota archaeon]|nr:PKD domain-containing protein [Candidatus Thermoplasmatota archaeon]
MRLGRLLVACTLVLSFALAGCATKTESSASASASGSQSGSLTARAGSTSKAPAPANATPPVAHAATLTASPPNGTAPLNVTFALRATGADAKTTWTLAFGDGNSTTGTTLPANATHRYLAGGNLTATLTVRFGDNSTANATVLLALKAGGGAASVVKLDKTGTFLVAAQTTSCGQGANAAAEVAWALPGPASRIVLTLSGDTTNADSDLFLYDPAGKLVKDSAGLGATEKIDVTGSFAAGTYKVSILGCAAVNGKWTLHGEATVTA